MRVALDWVNVEFANLRSGFCWAADHHDVEAATAIAAHTTMIAWVLKRYESAGWAEELLDAATGADLRQLPRLYTAAALCSYAGRPEAPIGYAETASELEADGRYDPFPPGQTAMWSTIGHIFTGRMDEGMHIYAEMAADARPGLRRSVGGAMMTWLLPAAGRAWEARTIAEDALPPPAPMATRPGSPWPSPDTAGRLLTPTRGEPCWRCAKHSNTPGGIDSPSSKSSWPWMRPASKPSTATPAKPCSSTSPSTPTTGPGDTGSVGYTLAYLAMLFDRIGPPDLATTLYGASTRSGSIRAAIGLSDVVSSLRLRLGDAVFEACVATGAAMDIGDAVAYARQLIRAAGQSDDKAS
jgi:hypothetical protein